jgi:hypothetical protein
MKCANPLCEYETVKITKTKSRKYCSRSCSASHRFIGNSFNKGNSHTDETKSKIGNKHLGTTRSEETKERMRIAASSKPEELKIEHRRKQSEAASNREFTGSSMNNYFEVGGIKCQGSSEKMYLERLIKNESELPLKCSKFIDTPYGKRQLDFEYEDRFIEIKSQWTFKFYENSDQALKDKWISENIKLVEVIVI